eukprot:3778292-Pleurochrysis_carterae.AAC.2
MSNLSQLMGDQFALTHIRGPWAPFIHRALMLYKVVLGGKDYEHEAITNSYEIGMQVLNKELLHLQEEKMALIWYVLGMVA